jgi:MFS transporter, FHS family, glucose/mannose:H+ symporter
MPPNRSATHVESLPAAPFYLGFVVAGMSTVLLGAILPVLTVRWSLTDSQAGALFVAQFTASTVGAIIASHFRRACLLLGYSSVAAGMGVLSLGDYGVAPLAFVMIGAGLGSATTATNLLFGTERHGERGALLARVNLFWGIGAVSCPPFIAAGVRPGTLKLLLLGLSLGAIGVAGTLAYLLWHSKPAEPREQTQIVSTRISPPVFVLFSLLLFLYVGGETSISGWIATYVHRFAGLTPERSSLFVSAFWLSIVLGRAVIPILVRCASEFALLTTGVASALIGISALLFSEPPMISLVSVVIAGLGCAPIFPLAVARLLARIGGSRHAGWIFAICGSGAAVLPWMTGVYSVNFDSLRAAFVVPLAALGGVLLLVLVEHALPVSSADTSAVLS